MQKVLANRKIATLSHALCGDEQKIAKDNSDMKIIKRVYARKTRESNPGR